MLAVTGVFAWIYNLAQQGKAMEIAGLSLWYWGLIFFTMAILITYGERQLGLRKLPSAEVRIIDDPSGYYLEVFNGGNVGLFKAQLEILDSLDFIDPQYKQVAGHWLIGGRESKIMKGHKDRIKIATLETPPNIWSASYRLYCNMGEKEAIWKNSCSWEPGSNKYAPAWFIIKVTISSEPELKGGFFVRTYKLDEHGLKEFVE